MNSKLLYSKHCTSEERERILGEADRKFPLCLPESRISGKLAHRSTTEREAAIRECTRISVEICEAESISTEVELFPAHLMLTFSTPGGLNLTAFRRLLELTDCSFAFRIPDTQELCVRCILYL